MEPHPVASQELVLRQRQKKMGMVLTAFCTVVMGSCLDEGKISR